MKLEIYAGDYFPTVVSTACKLATENNESVEFNFNGVEYIIEPGTNAIIFLEEKEKQKKIQYENWKNSEEGQAYFRGIAKARRLQQDQLKKLKMEWPNFQDIRSILKWCNQVFENGGYGKDAEILSEFRTQSLVPNMNIGLGYDADNQENAGRYLVGQFLAGIEDGAIPEIFAYLYEQWLKKNVKK